MNALSYMFLYSWRSSDIISELIKIKGMDWVEKLIEKWQRQAESEGGYRGRTGKDRCFPGGCGRRVEEGCRMKMNKQGRRYLK